MKRFKYRVERIRITHDIVVTQYGEKHVITDLNEEAVSDLLDHLGGLGWRLVAIEQANLPGALYERFYIFEKVEEKEEERSDR